MMNLSLLKTNVVITPMRLLDTYTGKFVEKDPRNEDFKYAILSHTWDTDGEQTYQELKRIQEWYAANINKSEKMSVRRADVAFTEHKRVNARGCPIWAMGRHPQAILAILNHMCTGVRAHEYLG